MTMRPGIILGYRDIGKFRPKSWDIARDVRNMKAEEFEQHVWNLAMVQATLTNQREIIARKMYHGEGITLEDFPALQILTPKQRTKMLKELRHIYGLRPICDCPERVQGKHRIECSRGRP